MCGLAPGALIGKETSLGHYGEVLLKISIVALTNSMCVYISILPRFINHHAKLAPSGMVSVQLKAVVDVMGYAFVHDLILSPLLQLDFQDPKLAKVAVRAINPVMLPFLMTRRRKDGTVRSRGHIGDGSCNFIFRCGAFRGTVGNDSCNSFQACAGGQGSVHDGACGRNSDSSDYFACFVMRGES
jgi:hypothetical protein